MPARAGRATLGPVPDPKATPEWDNPGSYAKIASNYAEEFFDELTRKPFDRERLGRFAFELRGKGRVCDVGTGPGQIAAYLAARGADAFGLDISEAMLREARRLCPNLQFVCGDMLALPFADGSLAGSTAFYSIIHVKRTQAVAALREMRRVLRPGGDLL